MLGKLVIDDEVFLGEICFVEYADDILAILPSRMIRDREQPSNVALIAAQYQSFDSCTKCCIRVSAKVRLCKGHPTNHSRLYFPAGHVEIQDT